MYKTHSLISNKNMIILFIISIIYTVLFFYIISDSGKINFERFIFILLLYLPEIIILILNIFIKKEKIKNQFLFNIFKITYNILSVLYFLLLSLPFSFWISFKYL